MIVWNMIVMISFPRVIPYAHGAYSEGMRETHVHLGGLLNFEPSADTPTLESRHAREGTGLNRDIPLVQRLHEFLRFRVAGLRFLEDRLELLPLGGGESKLGCNMFVGAFSFG